MVAYQVKWDTKDQLFHLWFKLYIVLFSGGSTIKITQYIGD